MEKIINFIHISQWKLRTNTKQEITNQEHRQGELGRGHVFTLQGACTFILALHLRRSLGAAPRGSIMECMTLPWMGVPSQKRWSSSYDPSTPFWRTRQREGGRASP